MTLAAFLGVLLNAFVLLAILGIFYVIVLLLVRLVAVVGGVSPPAWFMSAAGILFALIFLTCLAMMLLGAMPFLIKVGALALLAPVVPC